MIRYPIGIQTFSEIYKLNCIYVDKTQYVYKLATEGKFYFLARPRRFGKSLLVSTLHAYFLGQKEYFKGLAIEELEKEWNEYPVFYLNLNVDKYSEEGTLEKVLDDAMSEWEELYGRKGDTLGIRFKNVIKNAYDKTGKQVVVLVDEYDKPMLEVINNKELLGRIRATLKGFYSVLKGQEQYIRFAFLTGVTRFSHVSIFSDLNHLEDISMREDYAEICGVSEKELHQYFDESIERLAQKYKISSTECSMLLKENYDGYHFSYPSAGMYNPFSLIKAFDRREISDYWFASGTPTFLAELLRKKEFNLEQLEKTPMTADMIGNIENFGENPIPIIYQSGYLTIKDYDKKFRSYILGYPNNEVKEAFTNFLVPYFTPIRSEEKVILLKQFVDSIESGNVESFLQTLKTLFDDGDHRIAGEKEIYFQNCMYVIFKLMGFYVQVEYCTSHGRIDIVLSTDDYLYVMELKVGVSAAEAIKQIDQKGYLLPFQQDQRKLVKIGVAFDLHTRTITEWLIEGL